MSTIWKPNTQSELYHYGVLGMKWGVHKYNKHRVQTAKLREIQRQQLLKANANNPKAKGLISTTPITKVSKADKDKYTKASYGDLQREINRGSAAGMEARKKLESKASKKLQKLNARYDKQQAKADRKYAQAERKASSLFISKKSTQKAFEKASKYQFKANKAAARGKNWYEQMLKEYKRAGIPMTKENQEIGKELIRQIRASSRAMYAVSYVR